MLELRRFKGTVVVTGDKHFPDVNKKALSVTMQVIQDLQPQLVVDLGDLIDFYAISSFDKDPDRITELQTELDMASAHLKAIREISPNSRIIYEEGNHEERLRRFLWTKAPALKNLRSLQLDELLGIREIGVERVAYEEGVKLDDTMLLIHGDFSRKFSGYTARGMMEKHGGSGICGHCHRGGMHLQRDRTGLYGWYENYCLCKLDPDYVKFPDWQNGLSVIHFTGNGRFHVQSIPIIKDKALFGSRLYVG